MGGRGIEMRDVRGESVGEGVRVDALTRFLKICIDVCLDDAEAISQ